MVSISPDAIRAETVMITGNGGDEVEAYRAVPPAPAQVTTPRSPSAPNIGSSMAVKSGPRRSD
jgi:hypothetical protein